MTKGKPSLDVKEAILSFMFVERIKSELIIASKLLDEIQRMKEHELEGAKKLVLSFLDALHGEIQFALNVLGKRNFQQAAIKVLDAMERTRSHEYSEAIRRISEAISIVTTRGQQGLQLLEEKKLL